MSPPGTYLAKETLSLFSLYQTQRIPFGNPFAVIVQTGAEGEGARKCFSIAHRTFLQMHVLERARERGERGLYAVQAFL